MNADKYWTADRLRKDAVLSKPIVHFRPCGLTLPILEGASTYIYPVDHESELVSNNGIARTTKVLTLFKDGSFETKNTMYIPVKEH